MFSISRSPETIPEDMEKAVAFLKKQKTPQKCLIAAYTLLANKYYGSRIQTYTRFFSLFTRDIFVLWRANGFLHCTNINLLFATLLRRSGFFSEKDIVARWTNVWYISPHQYLSVKTELGWINVDIWGRRFGIRFGDYAHGFHTKTRDNRQKRLNKHSFPNNDQ